MLDFLPGQRYTSSGEPELGIGLVMEVLKERVRIFFPTADETRLYAIESAPLQRTVFKVGDTIKDANGQVLQIEQVTFDGDLYVYFGEGKSLKESEVDHGSTSHTVADRLFGGEIDKPEMFALRRETLFHNYTRQISPVRGFVGGKIDLIPHQLYIAHEVSSRFAPRVLLSDQVGLGKTIEASLILHRLLLTGRVSRVLILVPESLIHQWFVELLRKFGLWFTIFDEERCISLENSAPEGNPFLDDQLIICSIEFLAGAPQRSLQAITAGWDLLIVDEAHHLEWTVDQVSPEYGIVELLSKSANGLLLLTATPEQLGVESHFARLRLLDPNRFGSLSEFLKTSEIHKNMATLVEKLDSGIALDSTDKALLESKVSKAQIEALDQGGRQATNHLIEDLLDQQGPGRVLFRNTRAAMRGFPKRIAHLIPIQVEKDQNLWIERAAQEFQTDINSGLAASGESVFWFDEDPRVEWVLNKMKAIYPKKILLICSSKEKVLALELAISKAIQQNVSIFHEDLTLIQRDKNAAWFAEHDSAQILICSEIGSEGRNFQFAHHLILFDVPLHPELLEQRIGRLDRIGQKADIHIYVPYLTGSPQETLVRWYHDGLDAFNNNLEGGNLIAKTFGKRLLKIANVKTEYANVPTLELLISDTSNFQEQLKKKLAEGRDRLLEMNSFRPQVAEKLKQQIEAEDKSHTLELYLTKVFGCFDIEMEDLAARTYFLHPVSAHSGAFPSIPQEGIQISFDRKRALSREDVSFLSWDHPMVTGTIDLVLSSTLGSTSYGTIRGMGVTALLLEALFVLETGGRQSTAINRYLPQVPLRLVIDHTGKNVTEHYPIELLNKNLIPDRIGALLQNSSLVDDVLPQMIASASQIADQLAQCEIDKAIQRMSSTMDHEIDRLKALQKNNKAIRPDEIQAAINERSTFTALIKKATLRLDALQLIRQE